MSQSHESNPFHDANLEYVLQHVNGDALDQTLALANALLERSLGVRTDQELVALTAFHMGRAVQDLHNRIAALEERLNADPRGE